MAEYRDIQKCEKCDEEGYKRIDLVEEPVLCDGCYAEEIYGECDCDRCNNGYYEGDKMRCVVDKCSPVYNI